MFWAGQFQRGTKTGSEHEAVKKSDGKHQLKNGTQIPVYSNRLFYDFLSDKPKMADCLGVIKETKLPANLYFNLEQVPDDEEAADVPDEPRSIPKRGDRCSENVSMPNHNCYYNNNYYYSYNYYHYHNNYYF